MIRGNPKTLEVTIDGQPLDPRPSQKVYNHSPDGFAWGYAGSGPAQLALAILLHYTGKRFAQEHYQDFKFDMLMGVSSAEELVISPVSVRQWIESKGSRRRAINGTT